MRPNGEVCLGVVILGHDPAIVVTKAPELSMAGGPLNQILVPARGRQRQHALELPVVHFPSHRNLILGSV
jgi:hypothetical protein